jgi:hypothetical protein
VPEQIRKVLDHIVAHYVVQDEQKDIDLNAAPTESGEAIESDKREAARREADRAAELADPFRQGLLLAHQARAAGRAEVALDDRDPEQDRVADALIRFLVAFDLAASRTEETEPRHYVYHVAVDWDRLGQVAREVDVDLDQALA